MESFSKCFAHLAVIPCHFEYGSISPSPRQPKCLSNIFKLLFQRISDDCEIVKDKLLKLY